jgi:hypothetical protein
MGEENAVTMRRELGDGDPLMFLTLPFELLTGGGHQEWSPHVSGGKLGHGRGRNVRRSVSRVRSG